MTACSQNSVIGKENKKQHGGEGSGKERCVTCNEKECTMIVNGKRKTCPSKWIRCDGCALWYHGLCQELQSTDLNVISKLEKYGVRWYCETCVSENSDGNKELASHALQHKTTINKLDIIEKSITEMQLTYSAVLKSNTDEITKLKEDYAKVVGQNMEQMKKAAESSENTKKLIKRQQELNEADARRNNAILYGIEESEELTVIEQVKQFMKREYFKYVNQPVAAIRLGNKNRGAGGNNVRRPIKVIFENEGCKWDFIKRINSGELRMENIFCKVDVSQEVRNKEWSLRDKIREMKKEGDECAYRIRNMNIEKREPSGEWKPLKLDRNIRETPC